MTWIGITLVVVALFLWLGPGPEQEEEEDSRKPSVARALRARRAYEERQRMRR